MRPHACVIPESLLKFMIEIVEVADLGVAARINDACLDLGKPKPKEAVSHTPSFGLL
jgi:hypothetical protein